MAFRPPGGARFEWVHVVTREDAASQPGPNAHLHRLASLFCAVSCGPRATLPNRSRPLRTATPPPQNRGSCGANRAHISLTRKIGSRIFPREGTHPENFFRECSHHCEWVSRPSRCRGGRRSGNRNAPRGPWAKRGVAVNSVILWRHGPSRRPWKAPRAKNRCMFYRPVARAGRGNGLSEGSPKTLKRIRSRVQPCCAGLGLAPVRTRHVGRSGAKLKSPLVHAFPAKEHVEWGTTPVRVGHDRPDPGFQLMATTPHGAICDALLISGTDFPLKRHFIRKRPVACAIGPTRTLRPQKQSGRRGRPDSPRLWAGRRLLAATIEGAPSAARGEDQHRAHSGTFARRNTARGAAQGGL